MIVLHSTPARMTRLLLATSLASVLAVGCSSGDEKPDEKPTQSNKNAEEKKKEKTAEDHFNDAMVLLGDDGQGDSAAAEDALNKALEKDDALALAHYNLGVLMEKKGETGEAEFHYQKAWQSDPSLDLAVENLGVLMETGKQLPEARAMYEEAIEKNPEAVGPRLRLARILHDEGDPKRASKLAREALQHDAKSAEAYRLLAVIYAQSKRNQLARLIAGRGQKLVKDDPTLLYALAIVAKNEKDVAGARALLKTVLEKDPSYTKARVDLTHMALKVRDWKTAQRQLDFLVEAQPTPAVYNALGVSKKGQGDFEGAKAAYVKALELDEKFGPARFNLGILYLNHMNNPDEAERAFSLYLDDGGEKQRDARQLLGNAKTLIEARIQEQKMLEEMKRQEEEAARLAAEEEARAKAEAEAKAKEDAEAKAREDAEAKALADAKAAEEAAKTPEQKEAERKAAEEEAAKKAAEEEAAKKAAAEKAKKKKKKKRKKKKKKKAKKKTAAPEADDEFFD